MFVQYNNLEIKFKNKIKSLFFKFLKIKKQKSIKIQLLNKSVIFMLLTLESIGSIRKSMNKTEILIYSEYEDVISDMVREIGDDTTKGQKIIVVSKNNNKSSEKNRVRIAEATIIDRKDNVLTIEKSDIQEGPVIDLKYIPSLKTNSRGITN